MPSWDVASALIPICDSCGCDRDNASSAHMVVGDNQFVCSDPHSTMLTDVGLA